MQSSTRHVTSLAIACATFVVVPRVASAQGAPAANPGQFGGSAPGQFDPNAVPGGAPGTPPAPGGPAPAASPFGDMNVGGLTPPPPLPPPSAKAPQTTSPDDPNTVLDQSKDDDSERGMTLFWVEAGGGFEHVALPSSDGGADSISPGTGPMIDGGLGLRLLYFTLGARARLGFFDGYDLARVGGDFGIRFPIGSLEPRIDAGGGYAGAMNDKSASGFYARLGGGLDVFVANNLALGGDVSADLVGLYVNGSSDITLGPGVALGLHVGLHL